MAAAGDAAAVYARDAMIAWFRGEFAAANAIIDELCGHLAQIGDGEEYEAAFEAIHRRRLNWIPVLHLQKYFSIADVSAELRHVAANRAAASSFAADDPPAAEEPAAPEAVVAEPKVAVEEEATAAEEEEEKPSGDSSDQRGIEDGEAHGGPQEAPPASSEEKADVKAEVDGSVRPERIKISKGFAAKESVKGHMVNVVKGLKLYEDIFTDSELLALSEFVDELRLAGRGGELPGETYIFFNKEMKGNKREIIQLGVPLFQSTTEVASNIEPIPSALQTVIDHLVQWRLIPETRKPDSCIINFFDGDEHSQPYYKPPHLDNPISTLVLSETTIAFGRSLISDHEGKYKGSLTLPIKQGSLLVMRGNSADMARHVVCASPNRRVIITFVKVRHAAALRPPAAAASPTALQPTKAMTVWQPGTPPQTTTIPQKVATAGVIAWPHHRVIPAAWGLGLALHSPVVMVAPRRAMVVGPGKKAAPRNGTGVFLPWTVGPKKHTKHLPPRFQKGRLPSPLEAQA
ncbi:hypothetical protein OPV22_004784 [Ensete ventricosum]|uniref:Fe2OG dioxygenase domain-containing protein n=1 Tax=Ensete ventricosum TaxID=4639 RepID=A0AAV8RF50_ENSVE|nr:hypothetical protein OPV22_004784 [Ensete ventricosum]